MCFVKKQNGLCYHICVYFWVSWSMHLVPNCELRFSCKRGRMHSQAILIELLLHGWLVEDKTRCLSHHGSILVYRLKRSIHERCHALSKWVFGSLEWHVWLLKLRLRVDLELSSLIWVKWSSYEGRHASVLEIWWLWSVSILRLRLQELLRVTMIHFRLNLSLVWATKVAKTLVWRFRSLAKNLGGPLGFSKVEIVCRIWSHHSSLWPIWCLDQWIILSIREFVLNAFLFRIIMMPMYFVLDVHFRKLLL